MYGLRETSGRFFTSRLADGAAEIDLARFGDGRLAGDGDRFRETLPTRQRHVDRAVWPAESVMPRLLELLEALQLGRRRR